MRKEFLTYGYEKASLNRISAAAGVTAAALYRHFAGKEDMFYFLVKDALDNFEKIRASAESRMAVQEEYCPFQADWAEVWTDYIYSHYEGVKLLICRSSGSRFEHFEEELIRAETEGNQAYASVLKRNGKTEKNMTPLQWHILSASYVHLIFETVRQDMTYDEAKEHMRFVTQLLYPGWKQIFGIE